MRILVSGATGFAGRHLLRLLREEEPQAELHGTAQGGAEPDAIAEVTLHPLDLRDAGPTDTLLADLRPAQVYHLAARSSPRASWPQPWESIENNLRAQVNLLQACCALAPMPRVLVVSSGDIYDSARDPVDEETPFRPASPYAVSKIAQDMQALQVHLSAGLPVLRARPFNFVGPGQTEGFVAPDLAMQIARIEAGLQEPVIRVGNLAARRDFCDVRDVVRAMWLLLRHGVPGAACNIASGEARSIQSLLDTLLEMSATQIEVQVDPQRFLPLDVPLKRGDVCRLRQMTGWEPRIPFAQSLRDLLNDCRRRLRHD